jgi:hypothetical protein
MDLLALLATLVVGVVLGYWLQNPALAERQREVRLKLRHAKTLLAEAVLHEEIAQDKLRTTQRVRAQTAAMIDEFQNAPVLEAHPALSAATPIFEGMTGWLVSTGAMPQIEAPAKRPRKRKVSVTVGAEVREVEAELAEAVAS